MLILLVKEYFLNFENAFIFVGFDIHNFKMQFVELGDQRTYFLAVSALFVLSFISNFILKFSMYL